MIYNWFYIFNATDFEETGLVSRSYSLILDGLGKKDFLVTKGNFTGITHEGVFLPIRLDGNNPFEFDDFAVWIDDTNGNVFFGFAEEET